MKRIAAIYWPTTSVGGINSRLQYLRRAARERGDTFDVLLSGNQSSVKPEVYTKPHRVRGGDSYIDIDGRASHHVQRVEATLAFLHENYDGIFFSALVPHPNKMYGFEPLFLPLYTETPHPKVAAISDGYWHSYAEWGKQAASYVKLLTAGCEAYASPVRADGVEIRVQPRPFFPNEKVLKEARSKERLTVWMHQWKDIKGILPFLRVLPRIPGKVELYSNGIRYYQIRGSAVWKAAIGQDHFCPEFSGQGTAEFFGWIPLATSASVYRRAWFSVGLQGITAKPTATSLLDAGVNTDPKVIYAQGTYNNAETEALYYGAVPILHTQAKRSEIPHELFLAVKRAEELPGLIRTHSQFVQDPKREQRAREWVREHHNPQRIYNEIRKAMFS